VGRGGGLLRQDEEGGEGDEHRGGKNIVLSHQCTDRKVSKRRLRENVSGGPKREFLPNEKKRRRDGGRRGRRDGGRHERWG